MEYQAQTGFPFTISVFGDTANAGTVVGENPIRANLTGAEDLRRRHAQLHHLDQPQSIRNSACLHLRQRRPQHRSTDPACRPWTSASCANSASRRRLASKCAREFFNALNHTNLGTPNRFVNTAKLRQHHRSLNPRPRNPGQRTVVLLGSSSPGAPGLASETWDVKLH